MKFLRIQDKLDYESQKYNISKEVEKIFLKSGFGYIEPSIFESYDEFILKNERLDGKKTVKVINRDGNILILRPDITMNIARKLISKLEDENTAQVFYNAKVFRAELDEIKETRQSGIEIFGKGRSEGNKGAMAVAIEVISRFSDDFVIEIGCSGFIQGLIDEMNLSKAEEGRVKALISMKNRFELEKTLKMIKADEGMIEKMLAIFELQGEASKLLKKAGSLCINQTMKEGLDEVEKLYGELSKDYGYFGGGLSEKIHLDLSMLGGFGYYDGIIFKGYYKNSPKVILSGGRYDKLTESYGQKTSAIGFCVDIDEIGRCVWGDERWR